MEVKMIIGNPYEIAIQLEKIDFLCSPSGMFNFVFDNKLFSGEGVTTNLYATISSLKDSLQWGLKNKNIDNNDIPLQKLDFSEGDPEKTIILKTGELSDYGFVCWLSSNGNEDRFFYTIDHENTIFEKRFPKGTIKSLIEQLPSSDILEKILDKNNVAITTVQGMFK